MSVFLRREAEFSLQQVGWAMSLMSVPMLCSPVLITLLADRNVDPRRILAVAYSVSAVVLSTMFFSQSIPLTLVLFVFHGLAFVAMLPLQDGYYFSLSDSLKKEGQTVPEYPLVRVWGTVGFILPSIILFVPLAKGASVSSILPCAVCFCLLSIVNSFALPPVKRLAGIKKTLPTRDALRTIFSRQGRWLCIGLFFAFLASTTYYSYVGNYYDEVIGIARRHIALIINIGVVLEVAYTLLMPWLQRKIHLKGIMVFGLTAMAMRMFLLVFFPYEITAILTQLFHGMEILALYVGPVMFLDRLAGDSFRNSIQGVFTMAVSGVARVSAGVVAGWIVMATDLKGALLFGASAGTVSVLIVAFLFSRIPPRKQIKEGSFPVSTTVDP